MNGNLVDVRIAAAVLMVVAVTAIALAYRKDERFGSGMIVPGAIGVVFALAIDPAVSAVVAVVFFAVLRTAVRLRRATGSHFGKKMRRTSV